MVRRGGTVVLSGIPPGSFPLPIFDVVLRAVTIRGSIVGTRLDLQEALAFSASGAVKATVETARLEAINDVFERAMAMLGHRVCLLSGGPVLAEPRSRIADRSEPDEGFPRQSPGPHREPHPRANFPGEYRATIPPGSGA